MTARPATRQRVTDGDFRDQVAAVGLVGAAAIVIAAVPTALVYRGLAGEPYSPLNHFISELGERGVSTFAPWFDAGLMIGGACLGLFFVGLAASMSGILRFGVGGVGLVSGICGALVGVFPMNETPAHGLVALGFFLSAWIAVALFSVRLVPGERDRFPRWLAIPGAVTVAAFLAFLAVLFGSIRDGDLPGPGPDRPGILAVPLLEWATLVAIVGWIVLVAIAMLRRPTEA